MALVVVGVDVVTGSLRGFCGLAAWGWWVATTAAGVELAPVAIAAKGREDPGQIGANHKAEQKITHQIIQAW
jgi:hypothetical protein